MYCKEYRFDEERFTILGHEFCKTCSSSKSCENALWVYVEAISRDRKDARLLSMPRLSQRDILLVMCFICKFLS